MHAREVDGHGLESDLLVNYRTSITKCLPQSDIDMLYILCLAHEYNRRRSLLSLLTHNVFYVYTITTTTITTIIKT